MVVRSSLGMGELVIARIEVALVEVVEIRGENPAKAVGRSVSSPRASILVAWL